jgi:DNA-binding response OmpR family regulator
VQRYDRRALVLDTSDSVLGTASLALVSQGVDPLYACDPDEAMLLACEYSERIAALVVPGALPLASLDTVLERITPRLAIGSGAVLIVGPPRQRAHLVALRDRGVRWVVFEPYDAGELRFAVAAALASGDALEPRRGLRVPIRLPVSVRHAQATREGEIRNLSIGGAYVALSAPPEVGASLLLEFPIGERLLRTSAQVAHRQQEAGGSRAEAGPGLGIAFAPLAPLEARLLEGFVRERVESFRI